MSDKFHHKYRVSSTRLKNWNYSSNGYYFITICTQNREHFFGKIINDEMRLSEIGKIAKEYWLEIPNHFPFVVLDEFTAMPNHIHGIVMIKNDDNNNVETPKLGVSTNRNNKINHWGNGCLGVIINQYKRICTINIRGNCIFSHGSHVSMTILFVMNNHCIAFVNTSKKIL